MTTEQQQRIDRLWELQKVAQRTVQKIADQMGAIAVAKISIPQERWDELFQSWESANQQMQDIGASLQKLHGV